MKTTLNIKGMHCTSCAKIIEEDLKDKVKKISVDYSKGLGDVEFDEKKISLQQIKDIIKESGFTAS